MIHYYRNRGLATLRVSCMTSDRIRMVCAARGIHDLLPWSALRVAFFADYSNPPITISPASEIYRATIQGCLAAELAGKTSLALAINIHGIQQRQRQLEEFGLVNQGHPGPLYLLTIKDQAAPGDLQRLNAARDLMPDSVWLHSEEWREAVPVTSN